MDDLQTGQILARLDGLKTAIEEVKKRLDDHYVTKEAFEPVGRIVYAMVAVILIGFITTLSALIYVRHL